jgi:peptidoglycan hydrolase-like protein with peptidoglycan-binding domain
MAEVLKKGSKGAAVKTLQENLVKLGYAVTVDGIFGPDTENAVRQLQKAFGYNVDGIVGDATQFLIAQQIGLGWKANR